MQKLPVFATYANVMRFAFGRFFTTLRLSWLPVVLLIAAIFGLAFAIRAVLSIELFPGGAAERPLRVDPVAFFNDHIASFVFLETLLVLLQLIAMSAVAVSIHRVILFGDSKPGVWFNFPFGATELRFVAMGVISAVFALAIVAAVMVPVVFVVAGGDLRAFFAEFENWPQNMPTFVQSGRFTALMTGYAIAWIIVVVLFLRLFVWPPSIVATQRLSPAEPWRLTRGNVWRMIGLVVLTILTLYAVLIPVAALFAGAAFFWLPNAPAGAPDASPIPPAAPYVIFPLLLVFYFFMIVFISGLTVALVSYAYKALKGYDARKPIPSD